jgi:predicted nucleic acid-binding protein
VILADTSVWIDVQRKPGGTTATAFHALIDSDDLLLAWPVRCELLAGVAPRHRTAFMKALSALPVVVPSDDTWHVVQEWIPRAADRGHRFGLTDLLVAALAHEVDALVWSRDDDFRRMESLGFVRRYSESHGG